MRICVDAGHGGADPGAVGRLPFVFEEKEFNLNVALLLEQELLARGHSVVMTRRVDRALRLGSRAAFANRQQAELFISIHANAAGTPDAEGMEVFHFPGSPAGRQAATPILARMLAAFPDHRNRGVKEANFAVLRLTHMPAVLVECEFLTNSKQLAFLADPSNQYGLAAAIASGVPQADGSPNSNPANQE